jgi:hypothetical protein
MDSARSAFIGSTGAARRAELNSGERETRRQRRANQRKRINRRLHPIDDVND